MTTEVATGLDTTVITSSLSRVVGIVSRAVPARSALPIVTNLLLQTDRGRLKLAATDLDMSIEAWCGAMIHEEGATTVPARLFTDLLSTFPEAPVHLSLANRLQWECARGKGDLPVMSAEDYPLLSEVEGDSFEIPAKTLHRALELVTFAAATDDSRPVLAGVLVEAKEGKLTFAAADGYRLSVYSMPSEQTFSVILPRRALREVQRICHGSTENVRVTIDAKRACFEFTDVRLTCQLIQGTFPNYRQLIPSEFKTTATVETKPLANAVRRAGVYMASTNLSNPAVRMGFNGSELRVWAETNDGEGDALLDIEGEGEAKKWACSPRYLGDLLAVVGEKVTVQLSSPTTQGVFRNDEDFVHVVMPMFLNGFSQ
ncbi:MAG TPA: DNA polymerase III subunit beta [Tepidiformaceae bacterium]|nr:DNA polymerase III subunit beta [Tepidiformaceae bacterium]